MKKIVPESKFRHLKGVPCAKDQAYDGVLPTDTRFEGNICAINRKFIGIVLQMSGGVTFTVLRRDKPGRVEQVFRCTKHSSEIVELNFDRFNPNRIVSGSDDGLYLVWWIPDEGLTSDTDRVLCSLRQSQRRVIQSEWHPSAVDILIGINIDSINVFNVATAETLFSINTSIDNDQMSNACINYNGTRVAASFKDKHVRVYDLPTQAKVAEFPTHSGSKPIKVAWITQAFDEDILVTTGATKMSEREICLWRISNPSSPIDPQNLDNSTASYNVYYDSDTRVMAFWGRGESSIKFFEVMGDTEPTLYSLTSHQGAEAHRGVAFGNKLSCNFAGNEIIHGVRILNKSLEEVSFVVPRKSDLFQDDLFPDSPGEIPAMTAEEYAQGKVADPIKVNLKNLVHEAATMTPIMRPSSVVSSLSRDADNRHSKVSSTVFTPSVNVADEIATMKATLAALQERVRFLEERE